MGMTAQITKIEACPKCSQPVEFEPVAMLPKLIPLCDACEIDQAANWQASQQDAAWRRLYRLKLPDDYHRAKADQVPLWFGPALNWTASENHGGLGLIGDAGAGKSCTLACLLWTLRVNFIWWSGTAARDAAIDAAMADKDREGLRRKWESAMDIPVLALDDISQGRMTEAWSSKLFDLLETRLGAGLPTFWTSQISLEEIRAKIYKQNGGDMPQADAISRRLGQHSLVLRGA